MLVVIIIEIGVGATSIWLQLTAAHVALDKLLTVSLSLDIPRRWMCILSLAFLLDIYGFKFTFIRILWRIIINSALLCDSEVINNGFISGLFMLFGLKPVVDCCACCQITHCCAGKCHFLHYFVCIKVLAGFSGFDIW